MPTVIDVRDLGATGDGATLDCSAIQQAVDRPAVLPQDVSSSRLRKITLPDNGTAKETVVFRDCSDTLLENRSSSPWKEAA